MKKKNGLKTPGIYKPTNHTLLYNLVSLLFSGAENILLGLNDPEF